ncbi:nuclear transport factor 2 family protein [Pseudonocardia sp. H11422]|uniref:nuclear transport factor 2 family protein n=1 Tax=Pseudonocardia sp. H11422 TaxID=2835866 RepID=UPI001BDD3D65|nr:nuclear transport factor 2 family protein [Pseudonocardia sp. H11422]
MTSLESRLQRLEDLEAIRALDAEYCRVLDDGDWAALVALFTDDGEFTGLSHARGHEQLLTFFSGLADGGLTAFWHYVTNLEIDLDGDTAHVRSFLWQPCVLHGVPHAAAGRYIDTVVRVGGRWRYRSKRVVFHYFAPLADGWDDGRFTLDAARKTHPERTQETTG